MSRPMRIEMIDESGTHAVMIAIEHASVRLDSAEVDAVIQTLSRLRVSMQPPVPEAPPRSEQYGVEMDSRRHTEQHALHGGTVLFPRHAGLGWRGFALPPRKLARWHASRGRHLEAPREPSGLPNRAARRTPI